MERRHFFGEAAPRWRQAEATFGEILRRDFGPVEHEAASGYDFRTADGRLIIEFKLSILGARELHEALLKLVFVLNERPEIAHAVLVAGYPRMSREAVLYEWERLYKAFEPSVARRLGLVAVATTGDLALPQEPPQHQLLAAAQEVFHQESPASKVRPVTRKWSAKTFEVWKVLLEAWLRGEGPLSIEEIAKRSGCSRPPVNAVFELLQSKKELARGKKRSGGLSRMPRESLREVLVLANDLRRTSRFVDATGRRPDPESLARRINDKRPSGVAFGGVIAARQYQPEFDLNGLPRVDLTVHGDHSLDWLSTVDPALTEVTSDENAPVLVVHRLSRPTARFDDALGMQPVADPAETLLDLYDLRLVEQAEEFIRSLRAKGSAHV